VIRAFVSYFAGELGSSYGLRSDDSAHDVLAAFGLRGGAAGGVGGGTTMTATTSSSSTPPSPQLDEEMTVHAVLCSLVEPLVLGTLRQPPQVKETMALRVLQVVPVEAVEEPVEQVLTLVHTPEVSEQHHQLVDPL
jgi:hypothetical protein